MFIERLSFQISPPDRLESFIETDAVVWDPWLRQQKGYIRKHYQRYPGGRVDIRIYWVGEKSMQDAAAKPSMKTIEVQFSAAFLGVYTRLP